MARCLVIAIGFVATVGLVFSAPAWADSDPHVPDGNVGWCPAGDIREHISGGGRYCLGSPFLDGTFYAQRWGHSPSPFGPGYWSGGPHCSQWIEGMVQGAVPGTGACGGGPMDVNN
nr:hypothetical protein ICEMyc226_00054 [Mycolicibacterium sp.]